MSDRQIKREPPAARRSTGQRAAYFVAGVVFREESLAALAAGWVLG